MKTRYTIYIGALASLLTVGFSSSAMSMYLEKNPVDRNVVAFHALNNSNIVYVLGSDRKLWREFGNAGNPNPPPQLVDKNVLAFQPVDSHIVYVLGSDGKLWREFDNAWNAQKPRQFIAKQVEDFQPVDGDRV